MIFLFFFWKQTWSLCLWLWAVGLLWSRNYDKGTQFLATFLYQGPSPHLLWLVSCLANLELRQIGHSSLPTKYSYELKILTMYYLAISECSCTKYRSYAYTKNLSCLILSPVGHMWTFPTFILESSCLTLFFCDQSVLQAKCWNGSCMSLDQTCQFFDQ